MMDVAMDVINQLPAPAGSLPSTDRPPRRYGASCDYCRRRKIRCDGRKPTCANCVKTKSACQYLAVARSTRRASHVSSPPNSENRQPEGLHVRSSNTAPGTTPSHAQPSAQSSPFRTSPGSAGTSYVGSHADLDALYTSSSYTSAFLDPGALPAARDSPFLHQSTYVASHQHERDYDNSSHRDIAGRDRPFVRVGASGARPTSLRGAPRSVPSLPARSEDFRVRHELMAKAAEGRHRERIDFAEGHMDCDGWPADLVRNLLELHWNRQHHAFLITYRPSFMRDMACNGPFFSKILLNAILYGVAKFSDRPELQHPEINGGQAFLSRATTLLGSALLHPDCTVVQALLLLCNSLGAQGSSTNAPILYLRIALTMIDEFGAYSLAKTEASPLFPGALTFFGFLCVGTLDLNRERQSDTSETVELKRRIVWAAFSGGRAIKFPRHHINVSYDLQDRYEELEEWSPYAYPGASRTYSTTAYSVSTWKALCELCINVEAIISRVYSGQSIAVTARDHLDDLADRLQRWKSELPDHLSPDSRAIEHETTPMIMSLHALYETAVILLHRPTLESGRSDAQVAKKSWNACTKAAHSFTERLQSYRATFTLRRAPYLISYATYVASTIHVRSIAAGKQFGTCTDVKLAEIALTVCLDALEEGAKINAGVEKAQRIISNLIQAFGVVVPVRPTGDDMSFVATAPFVFDNQQANDMDVAGRMIWGDAWGGGLDAGADVLADTSWFLGADDPLMGYMYSQDLLDFPSGHHMTSSL